MLTLAILALSTLLLGSTPVGPTVNDITDGMNGGGPTVVVPTP